MKFSISFKYSNVTFKNKETKETISYDTKAETGNTFTFDNVDEDVVIGMVKGIKDKKASQVFFYDDLRTNFVNVMARNKCKELYDKLEKGGWKVEDVSISTITIKDLEFTKPTMNARENLTVESRKTRKRAYTNNTIYINWHWSSEYDTGDSGSEKISIEDASEENIKRKVEEFCNKEWPEAGSHCDGVYVEVFADLVPESEPVFLFDGGFEYGKIDWYKPDGEKHRYIPDGGIYMESRIKKCNESKETVEVDFKKTPDDGEVIAFFPQTIHDGSCNPGNVMSYMHNGQHGEASLDFYEACTTCLEEDYADLLHELEGIYHDCDLVVVQVQD